jgi:hypothetical protein
MAALRERRATLRFVHPLQSLVPTLQARGFAQLKGDSLVVVGSPKAAPQTSPPWLSGTPGLPLSLYQRVQVPRLCVRQP